MGGGILQLVLKGKIDTYLTGNPEFSFFKAVYRRHTNFSMEKVKKFCCIVDGDIYVLNYRFCMVTKPTI